VPEPTVRVAGSVGVTVQDPAPSAKAGTTPQTITLRPCFGILHRRTTRFGRSIDTSPMSDAGGSACPRAVGVARQASRHAPMRSGRARPRERVTCPRRAHHGCSVTAPRGTSVRPPRSPRYRPVVGLLNIGLVRVGSPLYPSQAKLPERPFGSGDGRVLAVRRPHRGRCAQREGGRRSGGGLAGEVGAVGVVDQRILW
jgi:hypothetical protein